MLTVSVARVVGGQILVEDVTYPPLKTELCAGFLPKMPRRVDSEWLLEHEPGNVVLDVLRLFKGVLFGIEAFPSNNDKKFTVLLYKYA